MGAGGQNRCGAICSPAQGKSVVMSGNAITLPEDKSLLIVEDDRPLRERLARAMQARGFDVLIAETVREGIAIVKEKPPAFAVVDLKLDDGNGLDVVESLHAMRPNA